MYIISTWRSKLYFDCSTDWRVSLRLPSCRAPFLQPSSTGPEPPLRRDGRCYQHRQHKIRLIFNDFLSNQLEETCEEMTMFPLRTRTLAVGSLLQNVKFNFICSPPPRDSLGEILLRHDCIQWWTFRLFIIHTRLSWRVLYWKMQKNCLLIHFFSVKIMY